MSTNLKVARERFTKLTQEEVADKMGISLSAYQKYEQGQRALRGDTLVQLAGILNVSVDTILGTEFSAMRNDDGFLTDDERALIDDYRALDDSDKSIVRRIASALNN
jgi:transcriptional regulator with XRE-family HTH domain